MPSSIHESISISISIVDVRIIDGTDIALGKCVGGGAEGDVYEGSWMGAPVAAKLLRGSRAVAAGEVKEASLLL